MPHWIWQHSNWPVFKWDERALIAPLAAARLAQGKLLGMRRLLDEHLSLDARAQILTEESVQTSAIEGEHLDLATVRSSVARHLGLPTAGLPPTSRSVDALVEVLLDATTNFNQSLTLKRLCHWQAALFPTGQSGLFQIRVGQLRGQAPMRVVSGHAGREKIHFIAPPRDVLEKELSVFLAWFKSSPTKVEGLLRAGLAHLWFVTLHPFEDGNGRLARAITDMALCQDEGQPLRLFSLSAQIMSQRENYYDMLEQTQRNGLDITAWLTWFLEQVMRACQQAEITISQVLNKACFWLQHQHTELNERQRKVMNRLLDAGPEGFKGGMNTRKYMNLCKTSRATAYRELTDLVEKGCLLQTGQGRSTGYRVRFSPT